MGVDGDNAWAELKMIDCYGGRYSLPKFQDNHTTFFNKTCMDKNLFCEENGFLGGASDDFTTCCDVGRNNCSIPISDVRSSNNLYDNHSAPTLESCNLSF